LNGMNHKYKLRAEAWIDLVDLADALLQHDPPRITSFAILVTYIENLPKFEMELATSLMLDGLLSVIGGIEDGHVMYQTVQPIECYTGERDWDREPPDAERRDRASEAEGESARGRGKAVSSS
jgi:hypothetical protein